MNHLLDWSAPNVDALAEDGADARDVVDALAQRDEAADRPRRALEGSRMPQHCGRGRVLNDEWFAW